MNISHAVINGETKDSMRAIEEVKKNPAVRVVIATVQSFGEGINFVEGTSVLFYSNTYSGQQRMQAEGRVYRKGQRHNCLFVDLVTSDSIDAAIIEKLQDKSMNAKQFADFFVSGL